MTVWGEGPGTASIDEEGMKARRIPCRQTAPAADTRCPPVSFESAGSPSGVAKVLLLYTAALRA
jgi:hypothetical protein